MSFSPDFETTQGDSIPAWVSTLGDASGTALDLTGATVTPYMWNMITGTKVTLGGAAVVVSTHPTNKVQYTPLTTDFATLAPGDYALKWRVSFLSGDIESFPADHSVVRVYAAPPTV